MKNPLLANFTWLPFRNDSAETIPPFAMMEVSGVVTDTNRAVLTCIKPTDDGRFFVSNGPFSVGSGDTGSCCASETRIVSYSGTIASGDTIGPVGGSWDASIAGAGLTVIGDTSYEDGYVLASALYPGLLHIKAPSGGIPGRVGGLLGTADCDVFQKSSSTVTLTGRSVPVFNFGTGAACASGDRHGIAGWCNGAWYVISEDCDDDGSQIIAGSFTATPTEPADAIDTETGGIGITIIGTNVTFTSTGYGIS